MSAEKPHAPSRLLLIEDDRSYAGRLRRNLQEEGFEVEWAESGRAALACLQSAYFDLVVTDIRMPDMGGIEVLRAIRSGETPGVDPDMPVVALTSVNTVETAVEAMRGGAVDYILKDAEKREVIMRLQRALSQNRLLNENRLLRAQLERHDEFPEIIGRSAAIRSIKEQIRQAGESDATVLIRGETGVGKELVARALHRASAHQGGPFLDVNCAALPDENFFQSELFGHERGAFTGAIAMRKGRFELAARGTLFLDEISEMSRESQGKILKALEQREITRLGGSRPIRVDCRIVCATNKNLEEEVAQGRFREDLFYRVNVVPIDIPPLRERSEDIGPIAQRFLKDFATRRGGRPATIGDEARALLEGYPWPGNVRELRNIMERVSLRGTGDTVSGEALRQCGLTARPAPGGVRIPEAGVDLEEVERKYVLAALEKAQWSQKEAARMLGISVDRMNARVRKFGLRHPSWRTNK